MSYHCERCGAHLDDLATQCGCDLPPTKAEIKRARIGHATPIMDAVIAERNRLRAENTELRGKLDDVRMGIGCARGQRSTQYCAEAAARDEVITKLLDLLMPGVAPPHEPCGCVECRKHEINEERYARACEIAGRTE